MFDYCRKAVYIVIAIVSILLATLAGADTPGSSPTSNAATGKNNTPFTSPSASSPPAIMAPNSTNSSNTITGSNLTPQSAAPNLPTTQTAVSAVNSLATPSVTIAPSVTPGHVEVASTALQVSAENMPTKQLWNLKNADILSLIDEVSQQTGKNFIVDPRVSGKITFVSSTPMDSQELYQAFLSALQVYGYAAIPSGNVIKVVPITDAKTLPAPIVNQLDPQQSGEIVVQIIPLMYVSAQQLLPILQPLLPSWANISAYTPTNVLIVTASADNVARIVNIIRQVDKEDTSGIEIIPLHYATATDVVTILNTLMSSERTSGQQNGIILAADQHTNSILVSGNTAERLHVRVLISELDTPASSVGTNTQVIYLHYLNAVKFAPILSKIADSEYKSSVDQGTQPGNSETAQDLAPTIQAEPNTNSLIITATAEMMQSMKTIIASLDLRPTQVLVEAAIVEVDENELEKLGIQWGTVQESQSDTAGGQVNGFASGMGVIHSGSFQAIINFLHDDGNADILSMPSIVVLDNQKASIKEGRQVGVTTGQYATTGSTTTTATPFTTTSRSDFDLELDVTPQISQGNAVQLQIAQSDNSLDDPTDPTDNPPSSTSNIKTSVIVNSGDILVLGGLMSNDITNDEQKIPVLGNLPVIGNAFTYKNHEVDKKDLLVFLHPIILHNIGDNYAVTSNKYNYMRDLQLRWEQGRLQKDKGQRVLPAWANNINLPTPFTN